MRILLDSEKCLGCHTCENTCAAIHSKSGTFLGAATSGERALSAVRIAVNEDGKLIAHRCLHCEDPECVTACPTGAMKKDPESGVVWCNMEECTSCFICAEACSFGAITPLYDEGIPFKCDLCRTRAEGPACIIACPTSALRLSEACAEET